MLLPDALMLYAGLFVGHRICFDTWLLPQPTEWSATIYIVLGVYGVMLVASGAYRRPPSQMDVSEFASMGLYLVGAWALSVTVTYIVHPSNLPPRTMMTVHGLVVLVGVLGSRAVLNQLFMSLAYTSDDNAVTPGSRCSVRLEDLVSRNPVDIDDSALRDFLSDRTVLVTGAGGSIGSELCDQLLRLNPFRLVLVDVSEHNLYQLERALRGRSYDGDLEFCIADVRDETVMNGLMRREQPDVVFHTAAYKHVPLMERHPAEAFRNNTMATVHLLRLCERHDVEEFVFVSTDKAVEPTSVLGATKQQAEWYVRTAPPSMNTTIVRFGNVFGSQGSVVPRFEEKLAAGEPVPITHPDMERYFMSAPEAARLLLQTLLLDAYSTYILKMGEPIRIEWLAERLIERRYPDVDPKSMIEYVGRRPGEKLSERLSDAEESIHSTSHPRILGLDGSIPHDRSELEGHFQHLQTLCDPDHGSQEHLRKVLLNAEATTASSSSPIEY